MRAAVRDNLGSEKRNACLRVLFALSYAHKPNCTFNSDAMAGHAFGILMACRGALRAAAPVNFGVST